jgi:hypothetical protein
MLGVGIIWASFWFGVGCSHNKTTGSITEDFPPSVDIVNPTEGDHQYVDEKVALVAMISDAEDEDEDLQVTWWSDIDGELDLAIDFRGGGETIATVRLSEGEHVLRIEVVDTVGQVGSDQIVTTVGPPNMSPNCAITFPTDGSAGNPGEMVPFTAAISDPDVAANLLTAEWASTVDGPIGETSVSTDGASVLPLNTLSVGTHTIQLIARDEVGGMCTDTIVFVVGQGPELTIHLPIDGAVVDEGSSVEFAGLAVDATDASGDLDLKWRSDVDGVVNEQPPDFDGSMEFQLADLSRGHHTITLWARNSIDLSNDASITLTVNGLPTAPEVYLDPNPATSADDLSAVIDTESEDPEGTEVAYTYAWYQNGMLFTEGSTAMIPSESTAKGEVWRVVVTPDDGIADGYTGEAEVIIRNSPPNVTEVNLSPDPAVTTDTLTCTAIGAMDWDGDAITLTYSWVVDGSTLPVTTDTIPFEWFSRGQDVYCEVLPTDGRDEGVATRSNIVTIGNSAPWVVEAHITPDAVRWGDRPTCIYDGYSDPDDDADMSTIAWSVNGVFASEGSIAHGLYTRDDTLTCTVTPSDGSMDGEPISTSVTVLNSLPSHDRVEMTPVPADVDDTIHCMAWGYFDPDGDPDDSYITWNINGGVWGISASISDAFEGGDVVTCTVMAFDGYEEGGAISVTQTIGNTPPTISGVSITPISPTTADTLTCSYSDFYDRDGDPDFSQYNWLVNGFESGVTGSTFSGGFGSSDRVTCEVTPYDGIDEGAARSETVVVSNSLPEITRMSFAPSRVYTSDMVRIIPTSYDMDGDLVTYQYEWFVNGFSVGSDSEWLNGVDWFERDDEISVRVTPFDVHGPGIAAEDGPVVVRNSRPTSPLVTVLPAEPDEGVAPLQCVIEEDSLDADGDYVSYELRWYVDGDLYTGTTTTVLVGDTVPADVPVGGEEWTCEVIPNDGIDPGVESSDTVAIAGWWGRSDETPAMSCRQIKEGWTTAPDGMYWLAPLDEVFPVFCDMTTDGGGWTLVAYTPTNTSPPLGFGLGTAVNRDYCVEMSDYCRLSDDEINAVLSYGGDSDDRFRLVAPGLPMHDRYYWNTPLNFVSTAPSSASSWWQVATSLGGSHSPGCAPPDVRAVGHEPSSGGCSASSTFGPSSTDRVFFVSDDSLFTGGTADSTYSWYAQ